MRAAHRARRSGGGGRRRGQPGGGGCGGPGCSPAGAGCRPASLRSSTACRRHATRWPGAATDRVRCGATPAPSSSSSAAAAASVVGGEAMEATSWSVPHDARRARAAAGRECSAAGGLGGAGWRHAQGGQGARRRAHARAAARCDGHAQTDPAGWKGTGRCGAVDLALARRTSRGRQGAGTAAQDVVRRGGGQGACARPND